jgi:uncharacterized protein (TIGR03083 family)
MEREALIGATEREGRALLDAGRAGLDAAVPSCAGWTVADVLGHVGRVYRSVAEILERRAQEVPAVEIPRPPEGAAVIGFAERGLDRVLAALGAIDPDEPVYSWSDQRNGGFYHRRMAHETAVHRWDAESAHGEPRPFEGELATDGVDEYVGVVLPFGVRRWSRPLPAGSLHLHRADGAGEWLLRAVDGQLDVSRAHAKGDVVVRGPAADLLLYVWNRRRSRSLELLGEVALADEWARLAP